MEATRTSQEIAKERADFLCKTINYVAGDANLEFNESHGAYWDFKIRDKTIPCLIALLKLLQNQFLYNTPYNTDKIGEIELIVVALDKLKSSNPTKKCEVTEPLSLAIRLKVN